jgi:seipin
VPQVGFDKVVYLQYGSLVDDSALSQLQTQQQEGRGQQPQVLIYQHPYGIAALQGDIVSNQAYDVSVHMHLPRSSPNLEAGNFMLNLSLTDSAGTTVLAGSRRPAILTYKSTLTDLMSTALRAPLLSLGWKRESEKLEIGMFEGVSFDRGWNTIPQALRLEVQTLGNRWLEVYEVSVSFHAKLSGLR